MIVRTVTAVCDDQACEEQVPLSERATQVCQALAELGWTSPIKIIERGPHGYAVQQTFCPEHS